MKRDSRAPLIVAIVLLLVPALYVGSYLVLVVPGGFRDDQDWDGRTWVYPNRHYRIERLDGFFWPLEQVDRKMRPGAWRPLLETGGKISLEFREWREETDAEANSRREIEETLRVLGTDP